MQALLSNASDPGTPPPPPAECARLNSPFNRRSTNSNGLAAAEEDAAHDAVLARKLVRVASLQL